MSNTIFLSPPWVDAEEREAIARAFDSGYVAPCGPQLTEFENAIANEAARRFAVVVSSGTSAIDLAMAEYKVDENWIVLAPTLTFIASVGPAFHRRANLVFIDCDETGNIDVEFLSSAARETREKNPRAKMMIIGVDLYGRMCNAKRLREICDEINAVLIIDAAEAVGARQLNCPAGSFGDCAIYSFNGNKIITTSGGGALLTDDPDLAARARARAQQSRVNVSWYEHNEVGYNYRLSNILAAIGLAQLKKLPEILKRKAEIASRYRETLKSFSFLPRVEGENNWLNIVLCEKKETRDNLLQKFSDAKIEARPVWKPMHLQPVFQSSKISFFGGNVAKDLFERGLCLPSGAGLTLEEQERVFDIMR